MASSRSSGICTRTSRCETTPVIFQAGWHAFAVEQHGHLGRGGGGTAPHYQPHFLAGQAHKSARWVHAQGFDDGSARFIDLVRLIVVTRLHGRRDRHGGARNPGCQARSKNVSALHQAGHLLGLAFAGQRAGGAVVVHAHGVQPQRVAHAQRLQQGHGAVGVVFHGGNLSGREGVFLHGQLVLQLGHGAVHAQGGAADAQHPVFGPAQRGAGHHHAHAGHQHAVGGAVHVRLLPRDADQCQQRGIGRLQALLGQFAVQFQKAVGKLALAHLRRAQQLGCTLLQVGPAGRASGRRLVARWLCSGLHLHAGDVFEGFFRQQHALQLRQVGAVAVARLFGVHTQLDSARQQHLQLLAVADDEAFVCQQPPGSAAQRKGQGLPQGDGVDVEGEEVHGQADYDHGALARK